MAKVLNEMPSQTRVAARKYEWESILDGTPRAYEQGADFDSKVDSFIQQARKAAADRDLGVSCIKIDADTVAIQAVPKDTDDEADAADSE